VVGRAATCDVVLRAPEVEPVHFLIEWVGTGPFDPKVEQWSLTDISTPIREGVTSQISAFGAHIERESFDWAGFHFEWKEAAIDGPPSVGGRIERDLQSSRDPGVALQSSSYLIEAVSIRADSGSITEVNHLARPAGKRAVRAFLSHRELFFRWDQKSDILKVLATELPGATIFRKGVPVDVANEFELRPMELLKICWSDHDVYIRLVPRVGVPAVTAGLFQNTLIWKISGVVFLLVGLLLVVSYHQPRRVEVKTEPPRVARIEIKQAVVVEPPAPPSVVTPVPTPPAPVTPVVKPPVSKPPVAKPPAPPAAQPRVKSPPTKPKNTGLNSPAKPADVNSMGLLGMLSKQAPPKGAGVRADMVINNAIVGQAVAGNENAKVVVRNPPAGAIGLGSAGREAADERPTNLAAASTTLTNAGTPDAASVGPLAGTEGTKNWSVGSGDGGTGEPVGRMETQDFQSEGGLDRADVRRVIMSIKKEVRGCYDRALFTDGKVAGRIVYQWNIGPEGQVSMAEIKSFTVVSDLLKTCVQSLIRGLRFPVAKNGKGTQVVYPFVFQAK